MTNPLDKDDANINTKNNTMSPTTAAAKKKRNDMLDRSSQFSALASYGNDVAEYNRRNEYALPSDAILPPKVEYTNDAAKCKDCGEYFFHDFEEQKYTCSCPHSIREREIDFSPFNVNARYKSLEERAAESRRRQQHMQEDQQTQYYDQTTTNRAKITTERGSITTESAAGYGRTGGSSINDSQNPGIFSIVEMHKHIRRLNKIESGKYDDSSRTSVRNDPTVIHPLDREIVDKGYTLVKSYELDRQPNSPGIISKDKRGDRKPYDRYGESANPDYKDPYDNP